MATRNLVIDDWLSDLTIQSLAGAVLSTSSNSNDSHIPLGYAGPIGSQVYSFLPALLKFSLDFSGVISITSAKLWLKTTSDVHVNTTSQSMRIRRITSAWSEHGGSEGNWSGSPEYPSTTTSGQKTLTVGGAASTWSSYDITTIVQAWFGGSTNHGIELFIDPSGHSPPVTTEFHSGDASASNRPYIELTYTTNTAPSAPTLTAPADGSRQTTGTPTFQFSHNDAEGDALASYDLQVDNNSDFSSPIWDASNQVAGISGNSVSRAYAGAALTRGTVYYWRCRTNDGTADGAWSATRSFRYNGLPTIVKDAPTAATLAAIHNLADLALWTGGGSHAKPVFKFTPTDPDGDTLTKYRLRIYDAAVAGGTVWDSGEVAISSASGAQITVNGSQALVNGTEYWWTIDAWDGYEWAGESSRTAFKVRWAQGLFEFDTVASATWSFATGAISQNVAIIFRSATSAGGDAATGKSAFFASIGMVPVQRWMQWLVRLSTATAGSGGTLADATFSYYGAPSVPDNWTVS